MTCDDSADPVAHPTNRCELLSRFPSVKILPTKMKATTKSTTKEKTSSPKYEGCLKRMPTLFMVQSHVASRRDPSMKEAKKEAAYRNIANFTNRISYDMIYVDTYCAPVISNPFRPFYCTANLHCNCHQLSGAQPKLLYFECPHQLTI